MQGTGQWGLSSPGGNGMGGVNNQAALDRASALSAGYSPQAQAAPSGGMQGGMQGGGQGAAPNNWQQAINSLANPGNPQTMGANVPMVTGGQPAGGVNQAFLNQAQGQPGMNPRFMSALAAIQGRPQQ